MIVAVTSYFLSLFPFSFLFSFLFSIWLCLYHYIFPRTSLTCFYQQLSAVSMLLSFTWFYLHCLWSRLTMKDEVPAIGPFKENNPNSWWLCILTNCSRYCWHDFSNNLIAKNPPRRIICLKTLLKTDTGELFRAFLSDSNVICVELLLTAMYVC